MARGDKLWESLTDGQLKEIAEHAKIGCPDKDIALLMDIPETSFTDSTKLRCYCTKKRAIWRKTIRQDQQKHCKNTPVGAIWLGKQALGQTDKQQVNHGVDEATVSLLGIIDGGGRGKLPSDE